MKKRQCKKLGRITMGRGRTSVPFPRCCVGVDYALGSDSVVCSVFEVYPACDVTERYALRYSKRMTGKMEDILRG